MSIYTKDGTPLKLDRTHTVSLYEQLYTGLRETVLIGSMTAGTRLPATRILAADLGISRNTVLAAYDQLIAEGYLETRQGAGTYVAAQIPDTYTNVSAQFVSPPIGQTTQHTPSSRQRRPGVPALDQFPKDIWARLVSRSWRTSTDLLMHDDPAGYLPLRAAIADYLGSSRGIRAEADQVLIVSGLQQGFTMVIESLLSESTPLFMEDPGYHGMHRAALATGHPVKYQAVDTFGATVPHTSEQGLLVISPSFQYPYGVSMPASRRFEILEWATQTNSLVFEDDYDCEFRYAGRPLGTLQGIDGGKRVIYGGSFSKSIFPALRLGYLILPRDAAATVIRYRAAAESFPSIVPQVALHSFMEEGHFASHIRRLRKTHGLRQRFFRDNFEKYLGSHFNLAPIENGLHLLARSTHKSLPDDTKLAQIAQTCGLGATALSQTFHEASAEQGLLLGFANTPESHIEKAIQKFSSHVGS